MIFRRYALALITCALWGNGAWAQSQGSPTYKRVTVGASTTSQAGLNIPHGVAPTSPVNGDVWTTSAGLYVRITGATVGPMGPSGGITVPTGIALGNGTTFSAAVPGTDYVSPTGSGAGLTGLTYGHMPALAANQILGALTATTPSGLNVPSCSGGSNALTWTLGAGFGCNTISGSGASLGANTFTGKQTHPASTTSAAGINLPQGVAPTSPANGDAWTTGSGLFVQIAGSTVGPLGVSGGSTTITLAPGLTSAPGTQNTGTQTIVNGSTLSLQVNPSLKTANYTLDTTTCTDAGTTVTANGSGSITFTLPNPGTSCGLGASAGYSFADKSGHGYTLAPAGGSATINGLGASATSFAVPAYGSVFCSSDGVSQYICGGGSLASSGGGLTSVGLSVPFMTFAASPLVANGTLTGVLSSQTANTFLAAPSGSSGTPTFRTHTTLDLAGITPFEIDFFYGGVPTASAFLAKTFSRATTVAATAPIKCSAVVGATASATVTLAKVTGGSSSNIGTLVFAASGSAYQTCTVTFSSSVSFAVGDLLTATFPGSADATLASVAMSIPAVQ